MKDKPKSFSWSFELDKVNLFAYTNNFLSDQECKDIIDIGKSKQLEKGSTGNNNINKTRKSNVSWICPDDNFQLYRKLTNYKAPDGKYDSHVDRSYGTQIRKLSIVILLSDDFEGGDFELISGDKPDKLKMEKGKLFLFPSFVLHRVKPITKGERNSLVAWVTGPNFK